jgi:RNA polymerase sigma-70 factor (ECF subfamily)
MSDLLHSIEPDTLLAHHQWMRRLARRLVLDDSEADDVVQEAWLRATERPPDQPGALRAWLATVVRNAAKQLARGESRRDRRELAAARPEALPATADLVARAEARRLLLDATLALGEPARTTVLLRFFEGLPPREIAKRLDVPVETVRSRVRRALADMRTQLDRKVGDRRAWGVALLPLAGPTLPGAVGPGEIPMDTPLPAPVPAVPWAAVAAVLVVTGGAVGWWTAASLEPVASPSQLRAAIREERDHARELRRTATELARATPPAVVSRRDRRPASSAAPASAATPEALRAEAPPSRRTTGPSTQFPAYRAALEAEDWVAAGRAFAALIRSVRGVAEPIAEGREPSPEALGAVRRRNRPVTALALRLQSRGVPGAIPNLVLAHPAVLANLLPTTLAALGEPLTAEQRTRLMRAAWDGIYLVDEAHGTLVEDDVLVRRLAVEAAALGPWLAAVDDVLTTTQRAALRPEEFRDRAGIDLVSPGLLWPALPPRVEAGAVVDYVRRLDHLLLEPTFPEGTSERETARDILRTWAAGLPAGAFGGASSPLDASGFAHAERLAFWAERTAELLEALRDGAAATRQQREALARRMLPLLPFMPPQRIESD